MKKLLAVLALSVVVIGAGAAHAAFSAGTYRGATEWKKPVGFTATKKQVSLFKIRVQYGCTDGDSFWNTEKGLPPMAIKTTGRFGGKFANGDGSYTVALRGTLTGTRAKGWFSAERTYNSQNNLDPQGSISCYVLRTEWKAKKRS